MDILRFFLLVQLAISSLTANLIPSYGYPPLYSLYSSLVVHNERIYIFGGTDNTDYSNSLSCFDFSTAEWSHLIPSSDSAPNPRINSFSFMYKETLFIFGGQTKTYLQNDLWSFDFNENIWKAQTSVGTIPSPRVRSSLVIHEDFLYLFGGENASGPDNSLYRLNLAFLSWELLLNPDSLPPSAGQAMFIDKNSLNLWGGYFNSSKLFQINLETLKISQIPVKNSPIQTESFPFAFFEEVFYIFPGFSHPIKTKSLKCGKIDLNLLKFSWISCNMLKIFTSFTQKNNKIFLFGGLGEERAENELLKVELSSKSFYLEQKTITPATLYPKPRLKHAMAASRGVIWLFGGCTDGIYFAESWKFDISTGLWEIIKPGGGNQPFARCGHKIVSLYGDTFLVFGGKLFDNFFNDILLYNIVSNTWTDVSDTKEVSAREGACLIMEYPRLFIHGGENSRGVLSDLWSFNIITSKYFQFNSYGQVPSLTTHSCFYSSSSSSIQVFSGSTHNSFPNPYIYEFFLSNNSWHILLKSDDLSLSNSNFLIIDEEVFIIGGTKYFQVQKDILHLSKKEGSAKVSIIGSLPVAFAFHDAVHLGRSLYIYGGVLTAGQVMINGQGSSKMLNVSLESIKCSAGFFGKNCEICPAGTYSPDFNSNNCSKCQPGTYSQDKGLSFYSQCFPCPYGTFSDDWGSQYCYECDVPEECRFRTVESSIRSTQAGIISVQPESFQNHLKDAESYNMTLLFTCFALSGLFFIFFCFAFRARFFLVVDVFCESHSRKWNEEPFPTAFGGIFSLVFFIFVVYFVVSPFIFFFVANVSEFRTLVPSFTLDHEEYVAKYCEINIKFHDYGGICVNSEMECHGDIEKAIFGVTYKELNGPRCQLSKNRICEIGFFFEDISFEENGKLDLSISDPSIFATGIEIYMKISSSIPPKYNESSIQFYIESEKNTVFNGIQPNNFYINLIPSVRFIQVFYSESAKWADNQTGYHITYTQQPTLGSTTNSENINTYNLISVSVIFDRNPSTFVIERKINNYIFDIISGILGSVAGILEITGILLKTTEDSVGWVAGKVEKKRNIKRIKDKRIQLYDEQIKPNHHREFTVIDEKDCKDYTRSDAQ